MFTNSTESRYTQIHLIYESTHYHPRPPAAAVDFLALSFLDDVGGAFAFFGEETLVVFFDEIALGMEGVSVLEEDAADEDEESP